MFGRRRRPPAGPEVYDELRRQILQLDPAAVGIGPTPELPRVWGLLMDLGANSGTATLVALADGTTSMYFSTGGGIIGGGERPQVASTTRRLLRVVEDHLEQMPDRTDLPLPRSGRVVLRVMTYQDQRAADAAEDDLGHRRHPLSEIFHRAHDVITELRLIAEDRDR